jgi:type IV pilus assembly protein PilA
MSRGRRGFTLIELMLVMVLLGILATIAVPQLSRSRDRAFIASVQSDLKILAAQMALYQSNNQTYPASIAALTEYKLSPGVTVTITEAVAGTGWAATGYHSALAGQPCGVYYGNASPANGAPATTPGVVTC